MVGLIFRVDFSLSITYQAWHFLSLCSYVSVPSLMHFYAYKIDADKHIPPTCFLSISVCVCVCIHTQWRLSLNSERVCIKSEIKIMSKVKIWYSFQSFLQFLHSNQKVRNFLLDLNSLLTSILMLVWISVYWWRSF